MITIDALKQFGADVEEGVARCVNNEGLYLQLTAMIRNEKNFDVLAEAIEANDLKKAFEAAHALKGVLANLSLTPLYETASEITELLRKQADADYPALLAELQKRKAEFDSLFD